WNAGAVCDCIGRYSGTAPCRAGLVVPLQAKPSHQRSSGEPAGSEYQPDGAMVPCGSVTFASSGSSIGQSERGDSPSGLPPAKQTPTEERALEGAIPVHPATAEPA